MCDKSTTLSRKIQLLRPKRHFGYSGESPHATLPLLPHVPWLPDTGYLQYQANCHPFPKTGVHRGLSASFHRDNILQKKDKTLSSTTVPPAPVFHESHAISKVVGGEILFHAQQFFHCFHAVNNQRQTELFRQLYLFLKHR